MRRFRLIRSEDKTGVSGTGYVAQGCQFDNGKVAVTFISGPVSSVIVYNSVAEAIHCAHGGTVLEWLDYDPNLTNAVYVPEPEVSPEHIDRIAGRFNYSPPQAVGVDLPAPEFTVSTMPAKPGLMFTQDDLSPVTPEEFNKVHRIQPPDWKD